MRRGSAFYTSARDGHAVDRLLRDASRYAHAGPLYWCHRFHHRFNRFICPVAANAVSPAEFTLAYALPFTIGAIVLRPDRATMRFFIWLIGFTNLLIHTPWLEEPSAKYLPAWLVSTASHMEHHRKLTKNYAAPTFDIDWVVRRSGTVEKLLAKVYGRALCEKEDTSVRF